MDNFYESILNLRKFSKEDVLKELKIIIEEEISDARDYSETMDGFCKIISNNIKLRLDELNLNSTLVNLRDYNSIIDHEFVLSSFKDKSKKVFYLLIDPTYSQFVKRNDSKLEYPIQLLENSNYELLTNLLNFGYSIIDNESFKNYMDSFKLNLTIDEIILSKGDLNETNIKNNKKR